MRRLAVALAIVLPALPVAAQDARPVVAVLPFENGGSYGKSRDEFEALRKGLAATLIAELARNAQLRLVDRAAVQRLVDQMGPGVAERVDAASAARVGQQAGAGLVVAASFIDLYGDFRIDARLIRAESGEVLRVVRSDAALHDRKDMSRMVQSVAERLADGTALPRFPAGSVARPPVPVEALGLLSRAVWRHDRGDLAGAADLYRQALAAHPGYAEAAEGLRSVRAP